MVSHLLLLYSHDAIFLLCNCMAIPKLLYLHTSPTWKTKEYFELFDTVLKKALQTICKVRLNAFSWSQAILPTTLGGLGIHQALDLCLSTFLGSTGHNLLMLEAIHIWKENSCCDVPPFQERGINGHVMMLSSEGSSGPQQQTPKLRPVSWPQPQKNLEPG